jgi:hypothetical protein
LTFLSEGLRFLAAGLALRVELAMIAPADFGDTPSDLAIFAWFALKPFTSFTFAIVLRPFFVQKYKIIFSSGWRPEIEVGHC